MQSHYYISSLYADANQLLNAVSSHWVIENNAQWSLDSAFNERPYGARIINAAFIFLIGNMLVQYMISKEESKMGLETKHLLAGQSDEPLQKVPDF